MAGLRLRQVLEQVREATRREAAQLLVELFLRATWEKLIAQKEQEAIAGQLLFFVGNVCVSLTLISLQRLKNFDMSQSGLDG